MEAKDITKEMMEELFPQLSGQHAGNREPYEAGGADYYYHRPHNPNFAVGNRTYTEFEMTDWQIAEYSSGYAEAEKLGDRKVW